MSFNVGDVVRLNSGGPDLTVNQVNGPNISVIWVADNEDGRYGQLSLSSVCFYLVRKGQDKHHKL